MSPDDPFVLASAGYVPGAVTDGAREAIRWTYYLGVIGLFLAQIAVILFWPMDGMGERIRDELAKRTNER